MKLLVLALLALMGESVAVEMKQRRSTDAHMIETGPTNYGITSSTIEALGWKGISVNGNNATIATPECKLIIKSYDALSDAEKSVVEDAKTKLLSQQDLVENSQYLSGDNRDSIIDGEITFNGNKMISSNFVEFQSAGGFQHNGRESSFNKMDDNNYSIKMKGMPANLVRVFVSNGMVTFVNTDGQIQMKPIECLQPSEQQLLEQFQVQIRKVEEQYKRDMEQMDRDMEKMHQDMAKMNEDMKRKNDEMKNSNSLYMNQYSQPDASQSENGIDNEYNKQAEDQQRQNLRQNEGEMQQRHEDKTNHHPFGTNWPFGPDNNPFGTNWPFGPDNNPFGTNWPFGPDNNPFGTNWPFGPDNNPFGPGFPFQR